MLVEYEEKKDWSMNGEDFVCKEVGKRTRKAVSKETLHNTVCAVFLEKGYSNATLSDIAGRLGVSAAYIETHFGSKSKLFHMVVDEIDKNLMFPNVKNCKVPDCLIAGLNYLKWYVRKDILGFKLFMTLTQSKDFPLDSFELLEDKYEQSPVRLAIEKAQTEGEIPNGDSFAVFKSFISCAVTPIYYSYIMNLEMLEDGYFLGAIHYRPVNEAVPEELMTRDALREALRRAELSDDAKNRFLFNMSHDLFTPMNAILGFADVAEKSISDPEKARDLIRKIKTAGTQLYGMINDILEFTGMKTETEELDETCFDISADLADLKSVFLPLFEKKNVAFSASGRNIRDNMVYGDKAHINRVIFNILGNALKFTPAEGKVNLCVEQSDNLDDGRARYKYIVSDNGIGMSREFIDHIFEDFSRENTSTESGVDGTGLGMSIVKKLVDRMGGFINVESEQGVGTTVTVELLLPKASPEELGMLNKQEKAPEAALEKRHILSVEDNALNREIVEDILKYRGAAVENAENGQIALDILREKGPDYFDAILMDIQMPVLNGYETTKEIRRMFPEKRIPIVALSANSMEIDMQRSFKAGMDAHLPKPVEVSLLIDTLSRYLQAV